MHPFGRLASSCCRSWTTAAAERHRATRWTSWSRWISPARRRSSARRQTKRERIVRAGAVGARVAAGRTDAAAAVERGSGTDAPLVRAAAGVPRPAGRRPASPPRALRHLSMGMSHDFEAAIEEGATMVRVGTAIFGNDVRRPGPMTDERLPGARRRRHQSARQPAGAGDAHRAARHAPAAVPHRGARLRQDRGRRVPHRSGRRLRDALREIDRLRQDLARSESLLVEHREREGNLRNTLLTAQRLADEIKDSAAERGAS